MDPRFTSLLDDLKTNDPSMDVSLMTKAYQFCLHSHGAQMRASGDPYYTHPLAVAQILTDFRMDHQSVITGLLHDTIEDTGVSFEEIEREFGLDIAKLVNGVTKLSQLELESEETKQAENFRKFVLAMSSDIRVLLVKLADRLHNMRTLSHVMDDQKKRRIAKETLDIYAPLAGRIGMQRVKDELEDIAFSYLNPEARSSLQTRLNFLYENADYTIEAIVEDISRVFSQGGLSATITGRQKTSYSIWRKMQHKRVAFEQLSDIMAFRVVVETVPQCYQALGLIHNAYLVLPQRFKDYISTPKPNGYQSLHTGLIGPFNSRIEVQIRTQDMHDVAEYGVAAHWRHKNDSLQKGSQYAWLRGLLDILEQTSNPTEFMEDSRLEMFQDQVFCFTPKGDLISLPSGATCIDFAYAVHSAVGDKASGVRINGRLVPLRTVLSNGDQVEIMTSQRQSPSPTWESFAVTGKARSRIRKFIRHQRREQFGKLGQSLLEKMCHDYNLSMDAALLHGLQSAFQHPTEEDLYAAIGQGLHSTATLKSFLLSPSSGEETLSSSFLEENGHHVISLKGLIQGMAVHFSKCCHPLPGDVILGFAKVGKGIAIHREECIVFQKAKEKAIDLEWGVYKLDEVFVGRMKGVFVNKQGNLAAFSTLISQHQGNIVNLKITNRTPNFWYITLDLEVTSKEHLSEIIASLRALPSTAFIERV